MVNGNFLYYLSPVLIRDSSDEIYRLALWLGCARYKHRLVLVEKYGDFYTAVNFNFFVNAKK